MKTLSEWIQVDDLGHEHEQTSHQPNDDLMFDNALASWSGLPFAELSQLLVHLRLLAMMHQTHHWIAKGDSFYGDHKLFDELYTSILEEIDDVGERTVGLSSEQNVALQTQLFQMVQLSKSCTFPQTVPSSNDLAQASLQAERNLLSYINMVCQNMEQNDTLTPGVENLLQQIADLHERHVYKLRRRCAHHVMGM